MQNHDDEIVVTNFSPIEDILAERERTHGDYGDHALLAQILKEEMRHGAKWESLGSEFKESLDMIAHKIGRILSGDPDFRDHWFDIAGYAQLSANRCSK